MKNTLIEEVIAGSYKSYSTLYDIWVSHLYRFVYSLVKSEVIAQDIVQDTFVKVWTNRATLNPDLSFKSYLFTISYHLVLKEFRHQLNHPQMEDYMEYCNDLTSTHTSADQQVSFDTFLVEVKKAKERLTPRQRQIFELSKEEDFSIAEIAEQLSLTDQSVRNQLSAALKVMREELKNYSCFLLLFWNI